MHPDDEPALKAAFADLHQRQREQAPSFAAMRERALRKADESRASNKTARLPARFAPRLAWAGAACAMALGIWWAAQTARQEGRPVQASAAGEDADKLITAIEQHLEADNAGPDYPTDLLLIENQVDLSQ